MKRPFTRDPVIDAQREQIHRDYLAVQTLIKGSVGEERARLLREERKMQDRSKRFLQDHRYYYQEKRAAWRKGLSELSIIVFEKEEQDVGKTREEQCGNLKCCTRRSSEANGSHPGIDEVGG